MLLKWEWTLDVSPSLVPIPLFSPLFVKNWWSGNETMCHPTGVSASVTVVAGHTQVVKDICSDNGHRMGVF